MPFFIIFIVIPLIELAIFASVSEEIGIWTTILLAFLTAIIGGGLVRQQGLHTLFTVQQSLNKGQMPMQELFDGFCIVAAGALLITPGFLTDTIGFLLLVPPLRKIAAQNVAKHFSGRTESTHSRTHHYGRPHSHPRDPGIIEGEYEEIENEDALSGAGNDSPDDRQR